MGATLAGLAEKATFSVAIAEPTDLILDQSARNVVDVGAALATDERDPIAAPRLVVQAEVHGRRQAEPKRDGERHEGAGAKSIQLVRTAAGWRISAIVWDDERPGLTLPPPP